MAATFCNSNYGSGIKKLNEYILNRDSASRIYPIFQYSGSVRSSCSWKFCKSYQKTCTRQLEVKHWRIFLQSSSAATYEDKMEEISTVTLIWRAAKLPIYSVALVPLTVATAAAYLQTGLFFARRYFVLLASSVLVITWLNLSSYV